MGWSVIMQIIRHIRNNKLSSFTELVARTDGNNQAVLETVRNLWKEILPSSFPEYEVLNDRISKFYEKEEKQTQSVMFFTFMSIVLATLGLFGYV